MGVLIEDQDRHSYRGDTLRFSLTHSHLFATTRGMTLGTLGYLTTFSIDPNTNLIVHDSEQYHQTKTSGGKANAIEVYPHAREKGIDWIVLTDDEKGYVMILEWDGEKRSMRELASVRLGGDKTSEIGDTGASHALWLT